MEHPHFTLGSAIVEKNFKSNYYSLSNFQQKDLGILNCGFRVNEVSDQASQSMIKEILCIAPKLGSKIASMANKGLVCGARLLQLGNKNRGFQIQFLSQINLMTLKYLE